MTRIVLVNAVYFKGVWQQKFNPESTREEDFYVTSDKTVKVQMMSNKEHSEVRIIPGSRLSSAA